MTDSVYDPDDDTFFGPIPDGTYTAMIEDAISRSVTTKNGPGVVLDISYLLQSPVTQAKLGRDKLTVRRGIFLDLSASGALDMSTGKNVELNRVRAAVVQLSRSPSSRGIDG